MTLSHRSRLVRWAYWYDNKPRQTSLCNLFWRTVLVAPLAGVIAAVTLPIWGTVMLWQAFGQKPYRTWQLRREAVAWEKYQAQRAKRDYLRAHPPDPSALKILWLGAVSIKKKFCPIVTFE